MYKCLDCEEKFEDPRVYVEKHGLDTPPYEQMEGCPECGGRFQETVICDYCGEDFLTNELYSGYCEGCVENAVSDYSKEFGLQFLKWLQTMESVLAVEKDFYLKYLCEMEKCFDAVYMVSIVKDNLPPHFEDALKEYCLLDEGVWSEFYYEGFRAVQTDMSEEIIPEAS